MSTVRETLVKWGFTPDDTSVTLKGLCPRCTHKESDQSLDSLDFEQGDIESGCKFLFHPTAEIPAWSAEVLSGFEEILQKDIRRLLLYPNPKIDLKTPFSHYSGKHFNEVIEEALIEAVRVRKEEALGYLKEISNGEVGLVLVESALVDNATKRLSEALFRVKGELVVTTLGVALHRANDFKNGYFDWVAVLETDTPEVISNAIGIKGALNLKERLAAGRALEALG